MSNAKLKTVLKKTLVFLSVTRSHNVTFVVLAQYLSAIFIFGSPKHRALDIILDKHLFLIVVSTSFAIASGYIINNFYDKEKDRINRPLKTELEKRLSKETKLKIYFLLNFLSFTLALFISMKAAVFYAFYIFALWFYSHKLKKHAFTGNVAAALLAVLPFFGILFYYKNFKPEIFIFGIYLYLVLFIKEIIKDLENVSGDYVNQYQTLPTLYGTKKTRLILAIFILFELFCNTYISCVFDLGYMKYFFYLSFIFFSAVLILLPKSQKNYRLTHLLIKVLLFIGVLSIVLLNPEVILTL